MPNDYIDNHIEHTNPSIENANNINQAIQTNQNTISNINNDTENNFNQQQQNIKNSDQELENNLKSDTNSSSGGSDSSGPDIGEMAETAATLAI